MSLGSHFSYVAFVLREVWARLFIAHYLKVNVQPSPFSCCVCFSTDCSIFGRQMHFSDWVSDGPDVHRRGISVCPRHGWGSRCPSELCGFRGLRWMDTRVDGDIVGWRWQSLSCVLLCFIWAWGRSLPYCSLAPDASWWCFIYQNWKSGLRLD